MGITWLGTVFIVVVSSQNVTCTSVVMLLLFVRLLDDMDTGGGHTQGHGMVLALHVLKQLKSSQKLSELLTKQYDSICCWLHCLQPFHQQLTVSISRICMH